jgi:hypothetical protein
MDRRWDVPERQLWCAVIDRALQDAIDKRASEGESARKREVLEARRWFIDNGGDYRKACDAAGLDADSLRNRILPLIAAAESDPEARAIAAAAADARARPSGGD